MRNFRPPQRPGPVTVQTDNRHAYQQAVDLLLHKQVLVGIPESNDERAGEPIGNAALGYIHEFGSPARNIPARPWLVPGVEKAQAAIARRFREAVEHALQGEETGAVNALKLAGQTAVNSVVQRIRAGIPPPLAAATIASRRRRTPGSSYRRIAQNPEDATPLIDTGDLIKAITFVVVDEPGSQD